MKTLTCLDMGGPCDAEFVAATFEDIKKQNDDHVRDCLDKGDQAHASAAGRMNDSTPEQQQAMMMEARRKFDEAPTV